MIRHAKDKDISRIAEILIFTKRMTYRPIFQDDKVSFGEMQVLPLAEEYKKHPERLADIWVYDDGFVKGLITLLPEMRKGRKLLKIQELYVDVFFHHEGIGQKLLMFAENMAMEQDAKELSLWVLEKNEYARTFYRRNGFNVCKDRKLEDGTAEYIVRYQKEL